MIASLDRVLAATRGVSRKPSRATEVLQFRTRRETFGPEDGGVLRPSPNQPLRDRWETFGPEDGGRRDPRRTSRSEIGGRPSVPRTAGSGDPRQPPNSPVPNGTSARGRPPRRRCGYVRSGGSWRPSGQTIATTSNRHRCSSRSCPRRNRNRGERDPAPLLGRDRLGVGPPSTRLDLDEDQRVAIACDQVDLAVTRVDAAQDVHPLLSQVPGGRGVSPRSPSIRFQSARTIGLIASRSGFAHQSINGLIGTEIPLDLLGLRAPTPGPPVGLEERRRRCLIAGIGPDDAAIRAGALEAASPGREFVFIRGRSQDLWGSQPAEIRHTAPRNSPNLRNRRMIVPPPCHM